MTREAFGYKGEYPTLPFRAAIAKLVGNRTLILYSHATPTAEQAEQILSTGLETLGPDILLTAEPLHTETDSQDAKDRLLRYLTIYTFRGHRYAAILGVERQDNAEDLLHPRYPASIVQPRPSESVESSQTGYPYLIDRRFVAGYFNIDGRFFVSNPEFDPRFDVSLLATTVDPHIVADRVQGPPTETI